jgi:hypothetical protein
MATHGWKFAVANGMNPGGIKEALADQQVVSPKRISQPPNRTFLYL